MKVVSIIGVRPQFIKSFPINRALRRHQEVIVNTGQHYDFEMSDIFLRELPIPKPHYDLKIGSGLHGEQTGQMLSGIEKILMQEKPDVVIVYGDTNSTLAGALAAVKLSIPVAHIEAGLRSHNKSMPEEINRIMTDHISSLLFCPTQLSIQNLTSEGIEKGVACVGDVMLDAALFFGEQTKVSLLFLEQLKVESGKYLLATIHRPSNADSCDSLNKLLKTFSALDKPVIFPVHPRTRKTIELHNLELSKNIRMISPVSYLNMLALIQNAEMVLTDSGGLQKEAFFFGIPCLTLRYETEWGELVTSGWNRIVGTDPDLIIESVKNWRPSGCRPNLFGNGNAGENIVAILEENFQ